MKNILLLGAGLSASSLIRYLLQNAEKEQWHLTIVDQNKSIIEKKIKGSPHATTLEFNALDSELRRPEIKKSNLVISMLPARFHVEVAKDCIELKKDLITPSYISKEMAALDEEAKDAGIIIMNEIGVDPGIDHMSAMHIIDKIRLAGGEMRNFESFTGGLIAPESDNNPWNYKFTWNPKNVVLAGQGGAAQFVQEGQYKYIPYYKLFRRTEVIDIDGYGKFEGYANRNSLQYRKLYNLEGIPTIYRGTLRRVGFSRAWDTFVQLGATDDSYVMEGSESMSYRDFINAFLPYHPYDSVELKLRYYLKIEQDDPLWEKLLWLDIFDANKIVGIKDATPAQILQKILEEKWQLEPDDKDMIIMYHRFVYQIDGKYKEITSEMVNIGEDQTFTSMSNCVGLPVAICAKKILKNEITLKGIQLPTVKEIYDPILKELEEFGIIFNEKEILEPRLYNEMTNWK